MCRLYSVIIIVSQDDSEGSDSPAKRDRLITGMMLPRRLMTPSTPSGMFGVRVTFGVLVTSRTLNTLMPKVSREPRENSRISILFDPARRVRASTLSSRLRGSIVSIVEGPGVIGAAPEGRVCPWSGRLAALQLSSRVRVLARRWGSNFETYSSTPTDLPICWLESPDSEECISTFTPLKRTSPLMRRVSM